MTAATKERASDSTMDPGEDLGESHDEQHAHAADGTGQMAVGGEVELGSHEYYVGAYPDMDWTPPEEVVL